MVEKVSGTGSGEEAAVATPGGTVDVHQHLWPSALVEALRARTAPPFLDGWTLHLPGEPPYEVTPSDHDAAARAASETAALAVVSLSSPLGLEDLHPEDAAPLVEAWHEGAAALPEPFAAWAAVVRADPDPVDLKGRLAAGFVGLQVPATWLATPAALEALAPVLAVVEDAGKPVLVHPGAVPGDAAAADLPSWWPAVVDYPAQLTAAWHAWQVAGRSLLPKLRIGFVAGAGLAPIHHERLRARGGRPGAVDRGVFVETSSYGPQAVDALVRSLGIDAVVRGSDRPYASPADLGMGNAAHHAVDVSNPNRFLFGGVP